MLRFPEGRLQNIVMVKHFYETLLIKKLLTNTLDVTF